MTQQALDPETIKAAVREHYGKVAQRDPGSSCGCGADSTCCDSSAGSCGGGEQDTSLYTAAELAQLPADAAGSSWGCGNPTALASLRPGEVVLDLGSGGGLDVLLAAQRVGPAGFVYGLDMTDAMLALARRNAAQVGATNVAFLKGDIEAIPLPDASVDVIISNCVINLTPDKRRALREAWRVLRPGGRVAISDIVVDGDLAGLPLGEMQLRAALSWTGCIAGGLTTRQYQEFLAQAGFEDISIEIQHRFAVADLFPQQSEPSPDDRDGGHRTAGRIPQWMQALAGRFTSSAIIARRPLES